jgi:hypothetical protein
VQLHSLDLGVMRAMVLSDASAFARSVVESKKARPNTASLGEQVKTRFIEELLGTSEIR